MRVVTFEHAVAVTAADLAGAVADRDRDLQRFGDVAGVAHHGLDVDAVGDHQLEEPVAQDFPSVSDGDRADARDLAHLAGSGLAIEERSEAHEDAGRAALGLRADAPGVSARDGGDQGVEAIRIVGLPLPGGAGLIEAGLGERFECGQDLGDVLGGSRERPVGGEALGPGAEVTLALRPPVRLELVGRRRDHPLLLGA
jgi:hypothetical protein